MTKKRAWQTLLWMAVFFCMNHMIYSRPEENVIKKMDLLKEKVMDHTINTMERSFREMAPLLFFETNEERQEKYLRAFETLFLQEIFSVADYCNKYWEDTDSLYAKEDEIPKYFLEAEEEKEEMKEDVKEEESMPKGSKVYTKKQLADYSYLIKNFYIVDSTTTVTAGELRGDVLAAKDLSIKFDKKKPKILLYHSHGSEGFADSKSRKKEETIIGTGDVLTEILEKKYGVKVYHDRTFYDTIGGSLDRSKAYTYAGNAAARILEKYPSIEVVIDLHRDAVTEGNHLVTTVNGKKTAKIMFFNGLSRTAKNGDIGYLKNPNKEDNLAFSLQMQLKAAELYPGLTRKIYLKGYRYNLHLKPRSLLIEVGAQTNTKEEAANAMEPLARLLYEVLKEK